jgi:enamine deaminase RidA (YjgF/YER057c/UK114 family)
VLPPGVRTVVTSGQCGFRPDGQIEPDLKKQIALAFENAEQTLQAAGIEDGWKAVYAMTTYAPEMDEEWTEAVMEQKRRYMGENRPAWTGVTAKLYQGAKLEMTLYAFLRPA